MAIDWKIFTQRPYIKSLSLEEQTRLFYIANEKSIRYRSRSGTGSVAAAAYNKFSLNFDGASDFVSIPGNVSNLNFGTGDLTYSIWVKASFSSSNRYFIGTLTDPTSNNGGIALGTHTAEYPSWKVWFSGTAFVTGTAAIIDGEWHHFVLTRDSGTVQVYIDGVADGASATITKSITNPVALQVGRLMNGLEYWNGDLDEFAIWDSALSPSQIIQLYNNGVPNDITSLSPIAWWAFNEGSGTTAIDSAGSNNGTINGATYSTDVPT
jgi:hypothetical protein